METAIKGITTGLVDAYGSEWDAQLTEWTDGTVTVEATTVAGCPWDSELVYTVELNLERWPTVAELGEVLPRWLEP